MTAPSRHTGGFTLLELLLAVTLLGLVFAVVAGIISSVLSGSTRVSESLSQDSVAGEVEDVIADDLAFMTSVTDKPPFSSSQDTSTFAKLAFYTSAGAKTAWADATMPIPPIHQVTYEVQPLPSGGRGLFRGEKPLVESPDVYYDAPLLLAGNVSLFKVEAYDGQKWQSEWPFEGGAPLPALIRISIDIDLPNGTKRQLYVESVPPIEYGGRPQEERRASGGADANAPAGEQNKTGKVEPGGASGDSANQEPSGANAGDAGGQSGGITQ
jgi:prepilin-type N-terminal cleavage/methylation domain-containing protein